MTKPMWLKLKKGCRRDFGLMGKKEADWQVNCCEEHLCPECHLKWLEEVRLQLDKEIPIAKMELAQFLEDSKKGGK